MALARGQARQFRDGGFLQPGEERQACRKGSRALGEEGPKRTPHGLTVLHHDRAFDTLPSISTLGAQTVRLAR